MSGLFGDEHVFADGVVTCVGQIIAIILAKDKATAQRAAKKVTINYTDLPSVITIKVILSITQFYLNISISVNSYQDAIAAGKFHEVILRTTQGDVQTALSTSHYTFEGSMRSGAQEHFYLETNVCLAIPKGEDGEMEIIASTQHVDGTQMFAAKALGVPDNRIVARVKRIGKSIICYWTYM